MWESLILDATVNKSVRIPGMQSRGGMGLKDLARKVARVLRWKNLKMPAEVRRATSGACD